MARALTVKLRAQRVGAAPRISPEPSPLEAVAPLVEAAAAGDADAWTQLVDRYTNLLWSIARGHRLSTADAGDVVQTTWLRLVEHLDAIRDPERVGAWLATTARNESLRVLRLARREVPNAAEREFDLPDCTAGASPEGVVIGSETDALLWEAVDRLPERCRLLMRMLLADPPPRYEEISAALDMPIGSIGPNRQRCLARLRRTATAAGITFDAS